MKAEDLIIGRLTEIIGLQMNAVGLSVFHRAMKRRMEALGTVDTAGYAAFVHSSPEEFRRLTDVVVVPETWFFRDRAPFAALRHYAAREWSGVQDETPFRLLSVPCSTGEEPYSMAMSLFDAGFPPESFIVDAIDISGNLLERARMGVFTVNSFRGKDLAFRDRYFTQQDGRYRLCDRVRDQVRFHQGNVLDREQMRRHGFYDVVFCRNLLIYLTREAQARTINILKEVLATGGILFVGYAEANRLPQEDFTPARYPRAFAFRRNMQRSHPELPSRREPAPKKVPLPGRQAARTPGSLSVVISGDQTAAPGHVPATSQDENLAAATQMADRGHLKEALALCDRHLQESGPSAGAYFLKGIICDATGDFEGSEAALRKAAYLEPHHYETLVFLALLSERRGEVKAAEAFRRRARKARGPERESGSRQEPGGA